MEDEAMERKLKLEWQQAERERVEVLKQELYEHNLRKEELKQNRKREKREREHETRKEERRIKNRDKKRNKNSVPEDDYILEAENIEKLSKSIADSSYVLDVENDEVEIDMNVSNKIENINETEESLKPNDLLLVNDEQLNTNAFDEESFIEKPYPVKKDYGSLLFGEIQLDPEEPDFPERILNDVNNLANFSMFCGFSNLHCINYPYDSNFEYSLSSDLSNQGHYYFIIFT
jgi:hypothetical protein